MKVAWVTTVFLKEFAEVEDEVVYGAGSRVHIVAPYDLQYLLARYYFAFMLHQ